MKLKLSAKLDGDLQVIQQKLFTCRLPKEQPKVFRNIFKYQTLNLDSCVLFTPFTFWDFLMSLKKHIACNKNLEKAQMTFWSLEGIGGISPARVWSNF